MRKNVARTEQEPQGKSKRKPKTCWTIAGVGIVKHRPGGFVAGFRRGGQDTRKKFSTFEDAKVYCQQLANDTKADGLNVFRFTDDQRHDATKALTRLEGKGSLEEAADYFMRHMYPAGTVATVNELRALYLATMEERKRRPQSILGFRKRTSIFCADYGAEPAHRITKDMILEWLDANGWSGLNRRHYISTVKALFNFALRQDPPLIESNPAAKIELPQIEAKEPVILKPADVQRLLYMAEEVAPQVVPALAVAFFAGVRPSGELPRLTWADIKLQSDEPVIRIGEAIAKKRHRRSIPIQANLAAWLTKYRREDGRVMPADSSFRRNLAKVLKKLNTDDDGKSVEHPFQMPFNAGRHAFASYAFKTYGQDKAAEWLGHGDTKLLHDTYKGDVSEAEASAFWGIVPAEQAQTNIVKFRATA